MKTSSKSAIAVLAMTCVSLVLTAPGPHQPPVSGRNSRASSVESFGGLSTVGIAMRYPGLTNRLIALGNEFQRFASGH